jgi:hypothetical protein
MRRTVTLGVLLSSSLAAAGTGSAPILGGQPTTVGQFPTVVAIEAGGGLCTATLITPEWVLTAAHCIQGASVGSVRVHFGTVNVFQQPGVTRGAAQLIPHPSFNIRSLGKHDIGLIKLSAPVTDITPVPVNLYKDKAPIGITVTMVGFGTTAAGGRGSTGIQMTVEQTSVACTSFAGSNDDLLCFSQVSGKGKCQGDSGGPSFAIVDGRVTQVGVTSFGDQNCTQFGADTRTDAEREFLLQHVPQLECSSDADCPDSKMCFQKRCIITPFAPGGLGAECTSNTDCDSQVCASDGDSGRCSATCAVGDAESCPAGLECVDTGGGGGACWPIEDDSGCCDAGGASKTTGLVGLLFFALVLGRKRRR